MWNISCETNLPCLVINNMKKYDRIKVIMIYYDYKTVLWLVTMTATKILKQQGFSDTDDDESASCSLRK
jgi:hypothetical protein